MKSTKRAEQIWAKITRMFLGSGSFVALDMLKLLEEVGFLTLIGPEDDGAYHHLVTPSGHEIMAGRDAETRQVREELAHFLNLGTPLTRH